MTTITLGCLYGAYWLYSAIVGPLTKPVLLPDMHVDASPAAEIKPLSIAGRIARTHLAGEDWAETAKYQFQRGEGTFLFCDQQMRIEDDKQNKMRVRPFALVWTETRDGEESTYTLVSDSAVIEFEARLQLGESNPGRIVWGQLQGNVRITGPDHLQIVGQNFILDEEAQRLHSDHPVKFAYGPQPGDFQQVRGRSDQVDIKLKESTESVLGSDMPRIGGLRQIALRRNVEIHLVMDDDGRPSPVRVDCKHEFTYDVESMLATFNDEVQVRRATHQTGDAEQFDTLECDRLQLRFEEAIDADNAEIADVSAGTGKIVQTSGSSSRRSREDNLGISLDLEFRSLWAVGTNVIVRSDENSLAARMQELLYDVVTRTLEMRDNDGSVEAQYRSDELAAPFISLRHDEDNQIQTAECLGKGHVIRRNPETQEADVESHWTERLLIRPEADTGLDVLEISGEAHVLQPVQETGIIADKLTAWLDGETLQAADGDLQSVLSQAGEGDPLPLRRVVATSNVALVSPTMHLEVDRLEVEFTAGRIATSASAKRSATGSRQKDPEKKKKERDQPVVVTADSVNAILVFDPESEKTDIVQLDAKDRVAISRATAEKNGAEDATSDPFTIEGDALQLRNQNGSHVLKLLGNPARIRHPEAEIEGNELYFDRANNLAMVEGAGALSILVESDLEGHPLEVPQPLTVRWEDQMKFDGLQAKFFGRVRTTLADSNMLCERMAVSLDRKLSFTEDRPDADGLEIERIECHDGVEGEYIEWEGTTLVGIRKVQVAEFVVERSSGDIRAQGPGRIDDWRKGGRQRHVRIDPTARTEVGASASNGRLPWEYTRVKFVGEMTGNQTDRFIALHDRVRVIHGPVENPLDTIDRDEFSQETERSKNTIWIGSDVLQVRLVQGETGDAPDTVSVLAKGNTELEGKVFRARADSISYDESNEMFTLKGRGTEANLWHQEQPGSPYRNVSAKTIQFVPSKGQLTLDETSGIRGGR